MRGNTQIGNTTVIGPVPLQSCRAGRRPAGGRWRRVLFVPVAAAVLAMSVTPAFAATNARGNDYNGDGNGDLVAVNATDGCLYRWNGDGVGSFGPGNPARCNQQAFDVDLAAVGDLTRDANADIVTIGRSDLCLYRQSGNGAGSFASPVRLGCGWGPYNGSLAGVGDLNGDGNGDLVAVSRTDNCLYRWSGDGAGSFAPAVVLGCGWGPYRGFVTGVGDITRDGRADLVAVNRDSGCLYRWNGDGAGSFGPAVQLGCGWEPYLPALAGVGDLNRDGNGDLVAVSRTDNCLYRWSGDGAGSFRSGVRLGCGWGAYIVMAN